MKTTTAIKLYNMAEKAMLKANSRCFIDRAIGIVEMLSNLYGEEVASEVIEIVFENGVS